MCSDYVNRIKEMDKNIQNKEDMASRKAAFLKQKLGRLQGAIQSLQGQTGTLGSSGGAEAALLNMMGQ
jgi:hypothetical protein